MNKRRKYRLTNKVLAQYFGYKNQNTLNSSTGREKLLRAVDKVIEHVENIISSRIRE
jgi:hypothetical protein